MKESIKLLDTPKDERPREKLLKYFRNSWVLSQLYFILPDIIKTK